MYSGLRTLAIVWVTPAALAIRHEYRLISSLAVAAISKSAYSAPASISTSYVAPFPSMPRTSSEFASLSTAPWLISTTDISCPSKLSSDAIEEPTFPHPTIIILINFPLNQYLKTRCGPLKKFTRPHIKVIIHLFYTKINTKIERIRLYTNFIYCAKQKSRGSVPKNNDRNIFCRALNYDRMHKFGRRGG